MTDASTSGDTVRISNVLMQPIAADDIAAAVAKIALEIPKNEHISVAGPDQCTQDELVREFLKPRNDPRRVVTDSALGYFGGQIPEDALVPDHADQLGSTHFSDWLARS